MACFFLQKLIQKTTPHAYHLHVAKWQKSEFKKALENLKPGQLLQVMDFAQNFTIRFPSEVQNYHWNQVNTIKNKTRPNYMLIFY